jgi:hypothetical protein
MSYRSVLDKIKERNRLDRVRVLLYLGNKCAHCGIEDPRVLQIDHVKGGGCKEAAKGMTGSKLYKDVFIREPGEKYQLLCANCNWVKRYENKEVPDRRK